MAFRICGLPADKFASLFAMSDAELAAHKAVRRVADANPGFPCRVGLRDAQKGEEVILVNYRHQPAASPYQASHAIFVARGSRETFDGVDEVPAQLRSRQLSLRAFNGAGFIVDAALVDGQALEEAIAPLLDNPEVAYVHAHFAKFGCYAALIERA